MAAINTAYFSEIEKQIESSKSCADLQSISDNFLPQINEQLSSAQAELEKFTPMLALLDPPSSPSEVVDWIAGLIENVITPLAKPALSYQVQIAELTSSLTNITDLIQEKSESFIDCEITV